MSASSTTSGKPVTDLKAEDFTLIEDGVRQEIRHLSLQTFVPAEPAPRVEARS